MNAEIHKLYAKMMEDTNYVGRLIDVQIRTWDDLASAMQTACAKYMEADGMKVNDPKLMTMQFNLVLVKTLVHPYTSLVTHTFHVTKLQD